MAFLNVQLWPLALLVLVPLAVHLFARARPRIYDFSSVAFIRRALRFTQRVRKPREWLLLLLRTAAAAALVLLFLRPVLHAPGGGPATHRSLVVILDASASMGWSDGSQTRFAVACAETSGILAGLDARDASNVILAGAVPRPVLPAMGGNIGYLQDAIRRARLTAEPLNAEAALQLAVQMLAEGEGAGGRREICVVSDFQSANWGTLHPRLPPGIGLAGVGIARGVAPNAALQRLTVEPPQPLPGEEAAILCEVANFSAAPRRENVVLAVGAARSSREVVVPPWGRATAIFRHRIADAESFTVSAALGGDAYPLDDQRWERVTPAAELRVGLLTSSGGEAAAAAWRRACLALGWASVVEMRPDGPAAGAIDVLLLAGWDGNEDGTFHAQTARGCPVVWSPAPGAPMLRLHFLSTNSVPPAVGAALASWVASPNGAALNVADPSHLLFSAFAGGEFGDPARGLVRGHLNIDAALLPSGTTLMTHDDGTPALWLSRGQPPLLLWNIALGDEVSTFQKQGEFVPLIGELLLYMRRSAPAAYSAGFPDGESPVSATTSTANLSKRGSFVSHAMPGIPLLYRIDIGTRPDEVRLLDPRGGELSVSPDFGRGLVIGESPARPGMHVWTVGGQPAAYTAVNFPVTESDLRTMSPAGIRSLGMLAAASGREMRQWQAGVQLWPHLLWLSMALLLTEGLLLISRFFNSYLRSLGGRDNRPSP